MGISQQGQHCLRSMRVPAHELAHDFAELAGLVVNLNALKIGGKRRICKDLLVGRVGQIVDAFGHLIVLVLDLLVVDLREGLLPRNDNVAVLLDQRRELEDQFWRTFIEFQERGLPSSPDLPSSNS